MEKIVKNEKRNLKFRIVRTVQPEIFAEKNPEEDIEEKFIINSDRIEELHILQENFYKGHLND